MHLKLAVFVSVLTVGLTGCGHFGKGPGGGGGSEIVIKNRVKSEESSSTEVSEALSEPYQSPMGNVKLPDNAKVRMWIKYFEGRGRHHMKRYLERSARYLPMMKKVLREEGLPEELVYVALIESGFSPKAHSRANAVGYWQFIRGTGKAYGLKIDGMIDERRDPVLSTRAAAAYFKALYNLFDDWHLSLAAYNTGENRVKHRIMRYYTRDFWTMARRRLLPRETRNYVPKYIAAVKIASNPAKHGFTDLDYHAILDYDAVEAKNPISLSKLAGELNVSIKEIKRLNPKFRGDYVPNYKDRTMMVRVPTGHLEHAQALIPEVKMTEPKYVYRDHFYYRVRRGDTLGHIARRYRTRVSTLRRLNRMGRRSFIRVGQRLKVPERNGYRRTARSATSRSSVNKSAAHHVVRRGENISLIAKKYGVSVSAILAKNGLGRRSVIRPGQKLVIRAGGGSSKSSSGGRPVYHTVRRGESLSVIAERYGVSLRKLMRTNNLGRRSILRVGQRLKIREDKTAPPSSEVFYHKVRRGENLTLIASKYGVSVSQLQRMNELKRRSLLYVGQKLRVGSKQVHVVRRGENLGLIARKYRVSISEIVNVNNLRNKSLIAAGQSLVIPQ